MFRKFLATYLLLAVTAVGTGSVARMADATPLVQTTDSRQLPSAPVAPLQGNLPAAPAPAPAAVEPIDAALCRRWGDHRADLGRGDCQADSPEARLDRDGMPLRIRKREGGRRVLGIPAHAPAPLRDVHDLGGVLADVQRIHGRSTCTSRSTADRLQQIEGGGGGTTLLPDLPNTITMCMVTK